MVASDVTLNASGVTCTDKTVTGSGASRVIAVSGCTGDGTVDITLAAGSASDLAGNQATSAVGSSATVDNTPPTIAVGAPSPVLGNSSASFSWTYTYTGADVITLNSADVTIESTGTVASCVKAVSISGNSGTVTLSGCLGDGTVKVSIAAGSGKDNAGNLTLVNIEAAAVTVDNTAPAIPTVAMYSPASSVGTVSTPQLQVTGIVSGDVLSIYTDNVCTNQVATATAGSTSLLLTTTALAAGTYNFYVKSQDLAGNSTACINTGVNYIYIACASNQRLVEGSCANPIVVTLSATTSDPGINLSASAGFTVELESNTPGVVLNGTQGGASDNTLALYPNGSTTVTVSLWPSKLDLAGLRFCSYGSFSGVKSIKTLESMGSYKVISGYRMFAYCKEFTTISDPTGFSTALSGATSFESMFEYATSYNQALPSTLDTSNVTNMVNMFSYATAYNQPLPSNFNTSNVTDMSYMFYYTSAYNQPLPSSFDTSKVTDMSAMFYYATAYNQALPASFDTSNVTNMAYMFSHATAYNQPLPSSFNTSKVTNMAAMFYYASAYNQPLPSSFDTSKVTSMNSMFSRAPSYNQPLPSSFDTSNVTDMSYMFANSSAYNQALPLSFNTAKVTDMSGMFSNASSYNQPLPASFDTSNVMFMDNMFYYATNYSKALPASFNTAKVINMSNMFAGTYAYNQPLPASFDTSNVTNMSYMFYFSNGYNQPLPASFNTAKVTDMSNMFYFASAYNQDLRSILNVCLVNSYGNFSTSTPIYGTANVPVFGDFSQCNKGGPQ